MRVAFVLSQDSGGPVDLTFALVRELMERPRGVEPVVVGPPPKSGGEAASLVRPVWVRSKADVIGGRALGRALAAAAPDVIHAQDRRAALMAATIARQSAPLVRTIHGVPDEAAGLWLKEGPLAGRRPSAGAVATLTADALVARSTASTVAPSVALADYLRRRLRVPEAKIRVIPNGLELPDGFPRTGTARTFISLSTFAPAKSSRTVVDAFAAVASSRPHLRLLMVGDGPERSECELLAAAHGISHMVEFTGFRSDVLAQLGRADAFVLPSINENLPLALIQAMGAGLACVASRIGGVPDLLENDAGLLIPPGDEHALAKAMALLADDSSLAPALSRAAMATAALRCSISVCADLHSDLWRAVLERSRSR